MERISNRLLRSDTASYKQIREDLRMQFREVRADDETSDSLADIAIRHLRTRWCLARYTRLDVGLTREGLWQGIRGDNPNGLDLLSRWTGFAARVAAMTAVERSSLIESLRGEYPSEDDGPTGRGTSLSPVRRAYGGTRREDRERLIRVFNTPFAPDILVASSVMGEGIDLHQECRHVIHHDLDWNPSKLEQRTGRLDRIGSLAERTGTDIEVYEPYLAGTHDEKMFLVVHDRAGWFEIVMGRPTQTTEAATDSEESRVPLHKQINDALTMDLRAT